MSRFNQLQACQTRYANPPIEGLGLAQALQSQCAIGLCPSQTPSRALWGPNAIHLAEQRTYSNPLRCWPNREFESTCKCNSGFHGSTQAILTEEMQCVAFARWYSNFEPFRWNACETLSLQTLLVNSCKHTSWATKEARVCSPACDPQNRVGFWRPRTDWSSKVCNIGG